jgi:hypothetical protein
MTPAVAAAIDQLKLAFPDHMVLFLPDAQGGAAVIVEDLAIGPAFVPSESWVGFVLNYTYPRGHVYPHFLRPDLARADGQPLTSPLNPGQTMPGFERPATMVSRASNRWDPSRDTATLKLLRVLQWLHEQADVAVAS